MFSFNRQNDREKVLKNIFKKLKNSYPAIVVFEDAEVIDIIQAKVDEKLSINHVEKFLNDNYVGELT